MRVKDTSQGLPCLQGILPCSPFLLWTLLIACPSLPFTLCTSQTALSAGVPCAAVATATQDKTHQFTFFPAHSHHLHSVASSNTENQPQYNGHKASLSISLKPSTHRLLSYYYSSRLQPNLDSPTQKSVNVEKGNAFKKEHSQEKGFMVNGTVEKPKFETKHSFSSENNLSYRIREAFPSGWHLQSKRGVVSFVAASKDSNGKQKDRNALLPVDSQKSPRFKLLLSSTFTEAQRLGFRNISFRTILQNIPSFLKMKHPLLLGRFAQDAHIEYIPDPFVRVRPTAVWKTLLKHQIPHLIALTLLVGLFHAFLDKQATAGEVKGITSKKLLRWIVVFPFFTHLYVATTTEFELIFGGISSFCKRIVGEKYANLVAFSIHSMLMLLQFLPLFPSQYLLSTANKNTLDSYLSSQTGNIISGFIAANLFFSIVLLFTRNAPKEGIIHFFRGQCYFPDYLRLSYSDALKNTVPGNVKNRRLLNLRDIWGRFMQRFSDLDLPNLTNLCMWAMAFFYRSKGACLAASVHFGYNILHTFFLKWPMDSLLYEDIRKNIILQRSSSNRKQD